MTSALARNSQAQAAVSQAPVAAVAPVAPVAPVAAVAPVAPATLRPSGQRELSEPRRQVAPG